MIANIQKLILAVSTLFKKSTNVDISHHLNSNYTEDYERWLGV